MELNTNLFEVDNKEASFETMSVELKASTRTEQVAAEDATTPTLKVTSNNELSQKSSAMKKFAVPKKVVDTVVENELFAKSTQEYVTDFLCNMKKTARSTLEMCRTVYEAERVLNSAEFEDFCRKIGYKDTSSTIRKFSIIGKVYPRLIEYAEQLPIGWTNIYQLTQISAIDFERCIKSGCKLNQLTGSELKELIYKTRDINDVESPFKKDKKTFAKRVGEFYFVGKIDNTDWRLIEKAFDEVCARLPIVVKLHPHAESLFSEQRRRSYQVLKKEDSDAAVKPHKWDYGSTVNKVEEELKSKMKVA